MLILIILFNLVFTVYLSYRLYKSFFVKYKSAIVISTIMILCNLFLIFRILEKALNIGSFGIIMFCADFIFAVCIYMGLCFLIIDIIKIIFKILHKTFINNKIQGIIVVILSVIICFLGHINSHTTKIKEYNITLNKNIVSPLKIVAFSDIHIGSDMSSSRLNKEVAIINNLKADVVFIVGDIIDNNIEDLTEEHIKELKEIKSLFGVYTVFGNHEYYSGNKNDIINLFKKAGFITLIDDIIYIKEKEFYIIGRDSLRHTNSSPTERVDIETLYRQIEDKTKPIIILDHIPVSHNDGQKINADIQISGHTHDGQFFPINLIVKKMYELSHGMINYNGFHFFVTSGLGLWGPPIRMGTDSEIIVINIDNK